MPKIKIEFGTYEAGRVMQFDAPDYSYKSARMAFDAGEIELDRLCVAGEMDDDCYVVQLWTEDNECLYDYHNGFRLYFSEEEMRPTTGKLNSPYGQIKIGDACYPNGTAVVGGRIAGEKGDHEIPNHWIIEEAS